MNIPSSLYLDSSYGFIIQLVDKDSMKYILVASDNEDTNRVIQDCLSTSYLVKRVSTGKKCLEMFVKRRYEFLFVDADLLPDLANPDDYKKQLQPF